MKPKKERVALAQREKKTATSSKVREVKRRTQRIQIDLVAGLAQADR